MRFPFFTFSRQKRAVLHSKRALLPLCALAASLSAQQTSTAGATPEAWNRQWIQASEAAAPARQRALDQLTRTIAAGPYRDDWQSLEHHGTPAWFQDAKFGIRK